MFPAVLLESESRWFVETLSDQTYSKTFDVPKTKPSGSETSNSGSPANNVRLFMFHAPLPAAQAFPANNEKTRAVHLAQKGQISQIPIR